MNNSTNVVYVASLIVLEDSCMDKMVVASTLGKALGVVTDWMIERNEWFHEGGTGEIEQFLNENWSYVSKNYVVNIEVQDVI